MNPMKRAMFLGALLLAAVVCAARPAAAKKEVRFQVPLENAYTGVRANSMVSVVLDDRDPSTVEVVTDARLSDRLVIRVERGILEIRMKDIPRRERKRKDANFAQTVVYVGREPVRTVQMDGMTKLTCEKGLQGEELRVSVSGMSKVETPLACRNATLIVDGMSKLDACVSCSDELRIGVGGMSKVKLEGQTDRLRAEVSGMSKLDAAELTVTESADCGVGGMSKAEVRCDGELTVRTEGMSKLVYSGNCSLASGSRVSESSLKKR